MKMDAKGSLVTINIDGKPLEKLIDVVSKGIGTLYRPRKIRNEADARAYAIKVLENAKAMASSETMLIEAETVERIGQRMVAQEIRRQNNIDSVVEKAAEDLKGKQVSDEPVDDDWAARFFNIVQDVSKDEMKVLWAKILAKEIEKPLSYSIRTLEILRNISFKEAELFKRLADYVLIQNGGFVFYENDILQKHGIYYIDECKLREADLLQSGEMVSRTYKSSQNGVNIHNIIYGNWFIQITLPSQTQNVQMNIILLTQAGVEIFELMDINPKMDYLKEIATFIKKKNPAAIVQYSRIIERRNEKVRYELPLMEL